MIKENQAAQCESYNYFTVSQGYRKVPGNKCIGGLDLSPTSYSCRTGFVSFKGVLYFVILALALYFGWPLIEALILVLPIPDPKDIVEKVKSLFRGGLLNKDKKDKAAADLRKKRGGYTGNFN